MDIGQEKPTGVIREAREDDEHSITPSALCLEQLDASLLMDFLQHLETERGNSPRTRNARLVAIKSFMRFMEHRVPALLEQSRYMLAIPTKRTDTRLINYLSSYEMQALLNAPDLKRRNGILDRAMLHLCFSAGLRVSERFCCRSPDIVLHPYNRFRKSRSWSALRANMRCDTCLRPIRVQRQDAIHGQSMANPMKSVAKPVPQRSPRRCLRAAAVRRSAPARYTGQPRPGCVVSRWQRIADVGRSRPPIRPI